MFCYPEHIGTEMMRVFGELKSNAFLGSRPAREFARDCAHFLAELNAIHPFRDGNGRTQLAFVAMLAHGAGQPLDLDRIEPAPFLAAMIESFHGREHSLTSIIMELISRPTSTTP